MERQPKCEIMLRKKAMAWINTFAIVATARCSRWKLIILCWSYPVVVVVAILSVSFFGFYCTAGTNIKSHWKKKKKKKYGREEAVGMCSKRKCSETFVKETEVAPTLGSLVVRVSAYSLHLNPNKLERIRRYDFSSSFFCFVFLPLLHSLQFLWHRLTLEMRSRCHWCVLLCPIWNIKFKWIAVFLCTANNFRGHTVRIRMRMKRIPFPS